MNQLVMEHQIPISRRSQNGVQLQRSNRSRYSLKLHSQWGNLSRMMKAFKVVHTALLADAELLGKL